MHIYPKILTQESLPNLCKLYEILLSQELAVPIQKICSKKNCREKHIDDKKTEGL